jgi:hypothetical protein
LVELKEKRTKKYRDIHLPLSDSEIAPYLLTKNKKLANSGIFFKSSTRKQKKQHSKVHM